MVGFLWMLNLSWLWIALASIIAIRFVYSRTVRNEEKMLQEKFGQDYLDYKKAVPAFIPVLFKYKKGEKWSWSFKRYFKSQEYKLVLWVTIAVITFHLKEEFIIEGESIDFRIIFLIVIAFLLGLTDAAGEVLRKREKRKAEVKL